MDGSWCNVLKTMVLVLQLEGIDEKGKNNSFKGIFQPFELRGVTRLIQSAVKFCKAGHLKKKILMIQSHERSLKQISAA